MNAIHRSLSLSVVAVLALVLSVPAAQAQDGWRPWRRAAQPVVPPEPVTGASAADELGRIRERTADPADDATAARFAAALARAPKTYPAVFIEGVLVGPDGMTLYTYGRDTPGASTCYGVCERLWPVHGGRLDDEADDEFTLVERLDGGLQWAYRGEPLYYWARDDRPGDITGDNVNEVWFVIREDAPPVEER